MLYNKEITIYKKGNMTVDENGIPSYSEIIVETLKVDIQPISDAKVKRTYGEFDNIQYRIYINKIIPNLNTSVYYVVYKSEKYMIKSIIAYDDDILPYMELLIGDRNEN